VVARPVPTLFFVFTRMEVPFFRGMEMSLFAHPIFPPDKRDPDSLLHKRLTLFPGCALEKGNHPAHSLPAMTELLDNLNPPQNAAVTCPDGPVLVVAGPGSGKTRVITHRIAWLVSQGVPPWRIIAITFTNKAADEMRNRVLTLVSAGSKPWVSTFHSSCVRILRQEISALGYNHDFTIYDTRDRDQLLRRILKEKDFDIREVTPAAVGRRISHHKNHKMGPGEFLGYGNPVDLALEQVWDLYEQRMRQANALDFDDLLLKTLELFDKHPTVRDKWSGRFQYVLVDEFQDTNGIQYELSRHLAATHNNLMVVGDPDQSIYAFRGSQVSNLLDFEKDFPTARTIRLEQNYRSTGVILQAAAGVIYNNRRRQEMKLWTGNDRGEPVRMAIAANAEEEARRVADQVREWLRHGIPPEEIAVFYRVNSRSRLLEKVFQVEGLAYRVVGALSFYQRREVKDLMAWLRLVANPADEVSFVRALDAPGRGVGDKGRDRILGEARRRGVSPLVIAADSAAVPRLTGKAREGLRVMAAAVGELQEMKDGPAAEILRYAVNISGYLDWLKRLADQEEAANRFENLQELISAATECDKKDPEEGLAGFLERVALVSDQDGVNRDAQVPQFMTLHTAKGLEFDAVAIVGLEEGTLPHNFSLDVEDGIEEERRLFYVGITRSRCHLHLSWAGEVMVGGEWTRMQPSAFLDELPDTCFGDGSEDEEEAEEGAEKEVILPSSPDAGEGVAPGAKVRHKEYGEGMVRSVRGWDKNRRVQVDFGEKGVKILLLEYSNLEFI